MEFYSCQHTTLHLHAALPLPYGPSDLNTCRQLTTASIIASIFTATAVSATAAISICIAVASTAYQILTFDLVNQYIFIRYNYIRENAFSYT